MSDTYENILGFTGKQGRVCRVAYTLNNTQPVVCTIIDDQPLFYMDYECYEEEEELFFDAHELSILEQEIRNLEETTQAATRLADDSAMSPEEKFKIFSDDKQSFSLPTASQSEYSITEICDVVSMSRLGQTYLDFAKEHDVRVHHNAQVENAFFDRHTDIISVTPHVSFDQQILLLTAELRRHWQFRQGALIHPLMFHPDNAILVNRVQVADLSTAMVRVAWELQLSGYKGVWEYIENSSMADLGRAFAREAFLDFRKVNNGDAARAVFEAWFLSERCLKEDKVIINQMLADYQGYVFDLEEAEQSITPTLIAAIGTMPLGKNYLSSYATSIMQDPVFTDVRDRSNANFLWFIKFERSFRETEQMLQSEESKMGEGRENQSASDADQVRSSLLKNKNLDDQNGIRTEQAGENVVTLFGEGNHPQPDRAILSNAKGSAGAEVISLRDKKTD